MIAYSLKKFIQALVSDRSVSNKVSKSSASWKILIEELPTILKSQASISDEYLIEGSVGKGLMSETPWLALFDKTITKSAQSGYYVVYLFTSDFKGVYLSLGVGWK
jgi:5-methylcytosine-specific restriction protein A